MNINSRLKSLEKVLSVGFITLEMPNGRTKKIRGKRILDMLTEMAQGIIKEDTQAVIDSVTDDCPATGNGHLTEVIKVWHAGNQLVSPEEAARLDVSE